MNTLFINATIRDESRTKILAKTLLNRLGKYQEENLQTLDLKPLTKDLLNLKNELAINNYEDKMFLEAKRFKEADVVVIAAPYYDLSFPSLLKIYIEHIMVNGLTFKYQEDGINTLKIVNVKKVYYVSTAGGPIIKENEGFNYIKEVFSYFFKVDDFVLIEASKLDLVDSDPNQIMEAKIKEIEKLEL